MEIVQNKSSFSVPRTSQRRGKPGHGQLVIGEESNSAVSEAFRILNSNLSFKNIDGEFRCIAVTSSLPGEGKSTTAANLALTMAQSGKRVLLLDADLRRPSVHKIFRIKTLAGLTSALLEKTDPLSICHKHQESNLRVLPAGILPPNSSDLLGSNRMKELLSLLREEFDTIILDCPPTLGMNDTLALSRFVDGFLLVVAGGSTPKQAILQTKHQLERTGAKLIGVVLNKVEINRAGYYGY